jgi:hypothetical protein
MALVDDAQRASFEASAVVAARREDPSGLLAAQVAALGIRSRNASGQLVSAPRAPLYIVRWSAVPRGDAGLRAVRLQDLYSEPQRRVRFDCRVSSLVRLERPTTAIATCIIPGRH